MLARRLTIWLLMLLPLGCMSPGYRHFERPIDQDALPSAAATMPLAPMATSQSSRQQLDEAISLSAQLKYDHACQILERLAHPAMGYARSSEGDALMPEVLFWLGYCRQKSGQSVRAASAYQQLSQQYPASRFSRLAQQRLEELSGQ